MEFLFAFAETVQCQDHNEVEAFAANYASHLIRNNGYTKCTIEMNYLLIVNLLLKNSSNNLDLQFSVEDTTDLVAQADVEFSRCFR